ncbi:hypothetical protein HBI56_214890 [Parastagonospora nodorum]|nr:hypothetical protein HBH56_230850 [Parastagonospora nodorum]KAH3924395.1 hypothetical protein HBH54_194310 [Parastagonospora nodorum]KAH3940171.1 hypothetical protein HBH53_221900 [Parastagonospora nodorum]KAH3958330.1 hypothetical protein HBH51_210570 [Parastagonospora nodorum]KAH3960262.1 hypothetical protein HBH52_237870 [Parastagonospora nodorum]
MCSLSTTTMCKRLAVSRPENTFYSGHTTLEELSIGLGASDGFGREGRSQMSQELVYCSSHPPWRLRAVAAKSGDPGRTTTKMLFEAQTCATPASERNLMDADSPAVVTNAQSAVIFALLGR